MQIGVNLYPDPGIWQGGLAGELGNKLPAASLSPCNGARVLVLDICIPVCR